MAEDVADGDGEKEGLSRWWCGRENEADGTAVVVEEDEDKEGAEVWGPVVWATVACEAAAVAVAEAEAEADAGGAKFGERFMPMLRVSLFILDCWSMAGGACMWAATAELGQQTVLGHAGPDKTKKGVEEETTRRRDDETSRADDRRRRCHRARQHDSTPADGDTKRREANDSDGAESDLQLGRCRQTDR